MTDTTQVVHTPLGDVHLTSGTDYSGREQVVVSLHPHDGCSVRHGREFVREHTYTYPPSVKLGEAVSALRAARKWLEKPQPPHARYRSHFGVWAPGFARFALQVTPTSVYITLGPGHEVNAVNGGKCISAITDEERATIVLAIHKVFGKNLQPGDGRATVAESIWWSNTWVTCRFAAVAHTTQVAAMRRYGTADDGTHIDVFKPTAHRGYSDLRLPEGWR